MKSYLLGKPLGMISAVQMDFCHEGGGVENPVQMVWGSYLVNVNHYWDTKFSSYFTIIFHDIHQNTI